MKLLSSLNNLDNIEEGTTKKTVTETEKTTWNNKQNANPSVTYTGANWTNSTDGKKKYQTSTLTNADKTAFQPIIDSIVSGTYTDVNIYNYNIRSMISNPYYDETYPIKNWSAYKTSNTQIQLSTVISRMGTISSVASGTVIPNEAIYIFHFVGVKV